MKQTGGFMDSKGLKRRTEVFGLRIIKLVAALPKNRICDVLGRQTLKAGTSVGANYREALRTSSKRHFITTLEIAQREADETDYWLTLIQESGQIGEQRLQPLRQECHELIVILTASIRTAKRRPPLKSAIKNPKSEIRT